MYLPTKGKVGWLCCWRDDPLPLPVGGSSWCLCCNKNQHRFEEDTFSSSHGGQSVAVQQEYDSLRYDLLSWKSTVNLTSRSVRISYIGVDISLLCKTAASNLDYVKQNIAFAWLCCSLIQFRTIGWHSKAHRVPAFFSSDAARSQLQRQIANVIKADDE